MWETRSKTFFVSELDKAIGGADLYYDRHSNIGYSRSSSFFVDGLVEKIQVLKRSDKIPDGVLSDFLTLTHVRRLILKRFLMGGGEEVLGDTVSFHKTTKN